MGGTQVGEWLCQVCHRVEGSASLVGGVRDAEHFRGNAAAEVSVIAHEQIRSPDFTDPEQIGGHPRGQQPNQPTAVETGPLWTGETIPFLNEAFILRGGLVQPRLQPAEPEPTDRILEGRRHREHGLMASIAGRLSKWDEGMEVPAGGAGGEHDTHLASSGTCTPTGPWPGPGTRS